MSSLNKVQLIGNLGADPEIKTLNSGDSVANLSIATSESWKDKNSGGKKERTEWHRVVMYGKLADIAGQYLRKGGKVYVEGELRTRKWDDKDGVTHYSTEVVISGFAGKMVMLSSKGDNQGGTAPAQSPEPVDELDDEIPF